MSFFFCGAASVSMQHSQAQGGNLRGEDESRQSSAGETLHGDVGD